MRSVKLEKTKRKALTATFSLPKKGKVVQLTAYYLQGGKWKKVKLIKGVIS